MYTEQLVRSARESDVVRAVKDVDLVLTVTSGSSGTKLLTALCRDVFGIAAHHEPKPRAEFALRPALSDPDSAIRWLLAEKLPAWAEHAGGTYVEASHIYCKGLLEPLFLLGLRPRLIILHRPAPQVASSLFQMGVVPARTEGGDLMLLRPDDPGVLPLHGWEELSDYALCYWYALEIERRQALYQGLAARLGLGAHALEMSQLLSHAASLRLAAFLGPRPLFSALARRSVFKQLTAVNQNARSVARPGHIDWALPGQAERTRAEQEVLLRSSPYVGTTPLVL